MLDLIPSHQCQGLSSQKEEREDVYSGRALEINCALIFLFSSSNDEFPVISNPLTNHWLLIRQWNGQWLESQKLIGWRERKYNVEETVLQLKK